MPSPRIEIENLRELRSAFAGLEQAMDLKNELKDVLRGGAEIVLEEALLRVPVRSGALKGTLRAGGGVTGANIKAGFARVPYAGAIQYGVEKKTGRPANIKPNPFLTDAADAKASEVVRFIDEGIHERIIQRLPK